MAEKRSYPGLIMGNPIMDTITQSLGNLGGIVFEIAYGIPICPASFFLQGLG